MGTARLPPRASVSLEADAVDAALSIAPLAAEQLLGSLDDPLSLRAGLAKEPDLLRRWAASKGKNPLSLEQKHLAKYILAASELVEHLNDNGWAPPSSKSTLAEAGLSLATLPVALPKPLKKAKTIAIAKGPAVALPLTMTYRDSFAGYLYLFGGIAPLIIRIFSSLQLLATLSLVACIALLLSRPELVVIIFARLLAAFPMYIRYVVGRVGNQIDREVSNLLNMPLSYVTTSLPIPSEASSPIREPPAATPVDSSFTLMLVVALLAYRR